MTGFAVKLVNPPRELLMIMSKGFQGSSIIGSMDIVQLKCIIDRIWQYTRGGLIGIVRFLFSQ